MALVAGNLKTHKCTIYYEIRGSGRAFILIPGINGSAVVYTNLARNLSSRYRVVTYDRRGYHRSRIAKSAGEKDIKPLIAANAEDIFALIKHISPEEPAILFGTSGGGAIAIELMVSHPQFVHKMVLHEPSIFSIFDESIQDSLRPRIQEILQLLDEDGVIAACQAFLPIFTSEADQIAWRSVPFYEQMMQVAFKSMSYFFRNELEEVFEYRMDMESLKRWRSRLILLTGIESDLDVNHRPIKIISDILGLPLMSTVGGHSGYIAHGEQFARDLTKYVERVKSSL